MGNFHRSRPLGPLAPRGNCLKLQKELLELFLGVLRHPVDLRHPVEMLGQR